MSKPKLRRSVLQANKRGGKMTIADYCSIPVLLITLLIIVSIPIAFLASLDTLTQEEDEKITAPTPY